MSVKIRTQFQGPGFVAVPNHVARHPLLSMEAIGVLTWIASHRNEVDLSVAEICDGCRFGKEKWQRIARELRAAGALRNVKIRGRGGKVLGEVLALQWPDKPADDREPGNPAAGDREPEKPAAGKPGSGEPENPPSGAGKPGCSLKNKKKKEARDAARALERFDRGQVAMVRRMVEAGDRIANPVQKEIAALLGKRDGG